MERRVDPDDGNSYTFEELVAFYKGKFSKKAIEAYWEHTCKPAKDAAKAKAKPKAKVKAAAEKDEATGGRVWATAKAKPKAKAEAEAEAAGPASKFAPALRRTRSWLRKVGRIALLPCEEALGPLLEEHQACQEADDDAGMEAAQLKVLQEHPFVVVQEKQVAAEALAVGVTCKVHNFRMDVNKFKRWLKTDEGRPFEEKGKGYDDGCYLTSAVLRAFMPRGYTAFVFSNAAGDSVSVVLRGFLKFTGLTATDEDEESGATAEVDAFMFHGFSRADAARFAITTKSNGENAKYTARRVLGEWYCFAGSKNTGMAWKLGSDAAALYPVPAGGGGDSGAAACGPKIVALADSIISKMPAATQAEFLEAVHQGRWTVMYELNDPHHEHIFPIEELCADHVALLDGRGYPLPQRAAQETFDKFGLRRVACDVHDRMEELDAEMEKLRASTEVEGAVIYLERADNVPVGLVKVKSDHYVIARRTREILRSTLVSAVGKGTPVSEASAAARKRLQKGMKELHNVAGCKEKHEEWAAFAVAFAEAWAKAYEQGGAAMRRALVTEFSEKYGSLYHRFWTKREVLPLCTKLGEDGAGDKAADRSKKGKGKG